MPDSNPPSGSGTIGGGGQRTTQQRLARVQKGGAGGNTVVSPPGSLGPAIMAAAFAAESSPFERIYSETFFEAVSEVNILVPSFYNALLFSLIARSDEADTTTPARMQFNGDTASNYRFIYGGASISGGMGGASDVNDTSVHIGGLPGANSPANACGAYFYYMPAVRSSFFKVTISFGGAFQDTNELITRHYFSVWESTAPIESMRLYPETGNFAAGTSITMFGVL